MSLEGVMTISAVAIFLGFGIYLFWNEGNR